MLTDETLLRPFDSARWVIAAPGGRHLLVNAAAADLFRLLARAASLEAAHAAFSARYGPGMSEPEFAGLVARQFGGYQLLHDDPAPVRPVLPVPQLRLRLEFIPPRLAGRLSAGLRPLYAPRVFWPIAGLLAAGFVAAALFTALFTAPTGPGPTGQGPAALPTGGPLWVALGLLYGSLLVHEFGHVAATARAGVPHGGIGCGLYAYLFPVLYADVSGIWQAGKQERIIANLGGIYAQLLYAAVLAGAFALSGYAPLRFAAGGVSIMALWQFNPFVRHDGYWLLSDLTNTPNLLPKANAVVRTVLSARGVRALLASRGRALRPGPRVALFTYGVLNALLLVFFIGYTFWHNAALVLIFPSVMLALLGKLLHGTLQATDVHRAQFVVLALYLVLARYVLSLVRRWRRPGSRPGAA